MCQLLRMAQREKRKKGTRTLRFTRKETELFQRAGYGTNLRYKIKNEIRAYVRRKNYPVQSYSQKGSLCYRNRRICVAVHVLGLVDSFKMELIGCHETSVTIDQPTLRNTQAERRPRLHHGGRLKSGQYLATRRLA